MQFVKYIVFVAGVLLLAAPVVAQGQDRGVVPPGDRPPRGMCRIWIDGVPPRQQPAPTDCSTAVRRVPPNARVIFGDDTPREPNRLVPSRRWQERERAPRAREDSNRQKKEPERRVKPPAGIKRRTGAMPSVERRQGAVQGRRKPPRAIQTPL
jgi:hypothetical protein